MPKKTYEDMSDIIDTELKKRRGMWRLKAISWMDYDDVSQVIRTHIYKKWDMWDQTKPLEPWVNRIISNQIKNTLRDKYGNFVRPCLKCSFNQGSDCGSSENLCGYTPSGKQSRECDIYAKWEKGKKHAYNVKLPVSAEFHTQEMVNKGSTAPITEEIEKEFHSKMMEALTERQAKAYDLMIIQGLDGEIVAQEMEFYTTEATRRAGYRQIKNLEKIFKAKAREVLETEDILIYAKRYGK